jgi:hypothetical protein
MAHPPTALPGPGRLMPLIEGKQQHHDLNGFTPGSPAHLGRVGSAPAGPGYPASYPAAAVSGGGGGGADGSGGGGSIRASKLLERLPGGRQALQWWKGGRSDSWRKQQEQLQRDKYDINQVGQFSRRCSSSRVRHGVLWGGWHCYTFTCYLLMLYV